MAPVFLPVRVAQIIRANVPAQTMTITEMPIKKYFTFIAPHTTCALMTIRTEYREMKLRHRENENFLASGSGFTPEFVAQSAPDGANVRLIFSPYKRHFSK